MSKSKQRLATLALAGLGVVMSGTAVAAGGMMVDSDGGLMVGDMDGSYWFKLGGTLQLDVGMFDMNETEATDLRDFNTREARDASNIRRARLHAMGGVGDDWTYNMNMAFATEDGDNAGTEILDAYMTYHGWDGFYVTLGQKQPGETMENATSHQDLMFMERSLASAFTRTDHVMGLFAGWHNDMVSFHTGIHHHRDGVNVGDSGVYIQAAEADKSDRAEPNAYFGRLTFAPVNDDDMVWHFGMSGKRQEIAVSDDVLSSTTVNFSTVPEITTRNTFTTNLGVAGIASVKHFNVYGGEMAFAYDSFLLQAEYIKLALKRSAGNKNLDFPGYHVQASYVLTGEKRPYDMVNGTFGRVSPMGMDGAWELAVRHSMIDTRDSTQGGNGAQHNTTVGVNYWMNNNVSMGVNYIRANVPNQRTANDTRQSSDMDIYGFRAQVAF